MHRWFRSMLRKNKPRLLLDTNLIVCTIQHE